MKTLMMTTAVCLSLATSAFADGHTTGFLDHSITENDLFASNVIGMRVYSAEGEVDVNANATADARTEWDDIGEINDLVVSPDGKVLAAIIGVGGFLGIGEKDVAVEMSQIKIMREADDSDDIFLVINSSSDALNDAPSFERPDRDTEMERDTDMETARADIDRPRLVAPPIARDGYVRAERKDLTAEMLTGARVYGANDEDVGEISSLLVDKDGKIDRAVIDVGGFLGLGEKPVAVTFDELTILREDGGNDVQVFIDSSQEALEAQPAYEM